MKKITLLIIAQLAVAQLLLAQENSQWRGANRDGIYKETHLLTEWPENGLSKLHETNGLGKGYASVAIANNKIYTTGTFDSTTYLFIMDMAGKIIIQKELCKDWTKTYPGARCTPTICGDKGYFISGLGELICFKAENGFIHWSKDLLKIYEAENIAHGISEILLIDGEKLFCTPGGKKATVVALNKETGDEIWTCKANEEKSGYCSPLLVKKENKTLLITNTEKSTVCINAENGELIWNHELRGTYGSHANTPIYKNNHLFIMDGFKAGCDMLELSEDGSSFEILWRDTVLDETNGHAVWIGDNIYISSESKKKFCCVDWQTGNIKYYTRKFAPGTVIYADGLLYCYSYKGDLAILEPKEKAFEVKGQMKLPKEKAIHIAHPVIKDGKLYIRYMDRLWIYNIKKS